MDPNADFSYHMGGALYIPQQRAPSPEPVLSRTLPESVPSSATTDLSPGIAPDPIPSVAVKKGGILEESEQSSLNTEENDSSIGSTGSAEYMRDDSEPLSEEPSRPLKRGLQEEEHESEQETSNSTTCAKKRPKKSPSNILKWDKHLEELKKYKATHGHCRLPKSCGSLYGWLNKQRNYVLKPNSPKRLQDELKREWRTKELESVLGTGLCDGRISQCTTETISWDARLEELKRYKATHGHCRLPPSCGSLYFWLKNQLNDLLNPNSPNCLKNELKRERRTKELESVLGTSLWDGRIPQRTTETIS